ncbi:family 16 glycosylhydrolase [Salibacteraceae bacterium]|nr:family 16 glycosylhydrolase [Salibacteraceae bacterium]MDC1205139.1 family 16 glycosylhydrolase [Salibacteraceae bacterium]
MFSTKILSCIVLLFVFSGNINAQVLTDDFEGNGTISAWKEDASTITKPFANPFNQGINTSNNVLKYEDSGGDYTNVFFDVGRNIDMGVKQAFKLKIYVPSRSISGSSPNQVSLKLQDGSISLPWSTQSEIVKSIQLDVWQELTFDFKNDNFINLDAGSSDPIDRTDFNRVLIQVNGENNKDKVVAYIDDFEFYKSAQGPTGKVYNHLVWSDEFNGSGSLDASKWYHQTKLPDGVSWYNGEIQHYTNRTENSYQANGSLHLVAKKETFSDQGQTKNYTSARLNSKYAFTYGRVEVRAKLPTGRGTWPAIWMLGKNIDEPGGFWKPEFGTVAWPACGEIDIMEHWGNNQDYVQSAMHTPSSNGATINKGGKTLSGASNNFHVYAVDWYEDRMVFTYDSVEVYTYKPATRDARTWPFTADQYILLNTAIEPGIDPSFTSSDLVIDYVRIYDDQQVEDTLESYVNEKAFQNPSIAVYPNPVSDILRIAIQDVTEYAHWKVLDMVTGEVIINGELINANNSVDVSELVTGAYLISVTSGQSHKATKFIKY